MKWLMFGQTNVSALREHHFGFKCLPDEIRVPAFGRGGDEVVKRIEDSTVDDIAFAILALEAEQDAFSSRLYALRRLYALARKNGAAGADRIVNVPLDEKGSR